MAPLLSLLLLSLMIGATTVSVVAPATGSRPLFIGADISMLPELEKAGAVYRGRDGKPADAIAILRDHGFDLFRVRLFVNPSKDFNRTWGATQDLDYVRALAKRIKASGATFLLDLHYSDTWADPGKQHKPAAWKELDFDALEKQVYDYTASVLADLQQSGAMPDMVQVGNEIAPGMLWPDGKVLNAPKSEEEAAWRRFARLFDAGARAVRDASTARHPIRVVLHIHGGGHKGLPMWFFGKFNRFCTNYDVIALSFYPGPKENFDDLKQSLRELIQTYDKDVLIAEVAYPWKPTDDPPDPNRRWPLTPQGQAQFVRDLMQVLRTAPNSRVIGVAWWYPESIPVAGLGIWKNGAMALFDETGQPLPAMEQFRSSLAD
ncbi:glycoside hydrolase family 53 protein [Fontivita pretiosa]|uniref:glycoside hydrolase family 53 protein n=1 Tax=Fontivita pretiosa TaxID=2989684 RepID=UPI003D16635B